jgi:hypothetical protein
MSNVEVTTDEPIKWKHLKNGITVVPSGELHVLDDADTHADIHISVEYNKIVDRYIATRVTVERSKKLHEVAGSVLREIRVQEIIQEGTTQMVFSYWDPDKPRLAVDVIAEFEPPRGRTNSMDLERVAFVYRASRIMNIPPLKEVSRVFDVSHSTATRLVARIRDEKRIDF